MPGDSKNGIVYAKLGSMIRQFQPADAVACCKLIQGCLADDSSISPALRKKLMAAETPDSMVKRASLFYVAVYEGEGRVLGVAGLDLNEIRLLCVSPQTRRQGVGRALLDHFRGMVPGILFPDMFVYSSIQGRDFYRAFGFEEKGPTTFDFAGDRLQTIFMSLPLR